MSDMPSIDKVQRSIRVQRETDRKILKMFRVNRKMSVKDAYVLALQFAVRDVELTAEDNEAIAMDKREALKRRTEKAKVTKR